MSRRKKRGKRFVMLEDRVLNSIAGKLVSTNGLWVYIRIKQKYNGYNENDLSLTHREVKYKIKSSATFYNVIIPELLKLGFIEIVKKGGLHKQPNIYKLSEEWKYITESMQDVSKLSNPGNNNELKINNLGNPEIYNTGSVEDSDNCNNKLTTDGRSI